jgi:hypothetical protein
VYRPRLLLASAFLAVAGTVTTAVVWVGAPSPSDDGPHCRHAIPRGSGTPAVWQTTTLFVTEVVLRGDPACGYDLSTKRLRGGLSRRDWARGGGPVRPFVTRYRPTPVTRASPDPNSPEAVYVLSRQRRELVRIDAQGRWLIAMSVGLSAPDAGMSAYRLVLELEDGNWRVDRAWPVELHFSDE